jgi:glycosyltransferase involved in cell wall biosynthesis
VNGRAPRLAVLLVGHGPPTTGGIPSFVTRLVGDGWLAERCAIEYVNTAPDGEKLPGAFTASNLWLTAVHARTLFRRSRGADVVHLNLAAAPTLPLIRALALTVACRLAGTPVILHAHTGMIEACVQGWLFRSIMRLELRAASLLIVVSTAAERATAPLGAPGRVAYLPNGVDPAAFSTGPKDEDPPLVAFVGTVAERKGLIDLRDALRTLRGPGGDLPDILDHGNAGMLVPPRDPGSLSRALDGLLRDAGERRRLGEAGRRRVEHHYGQGRLVERLYDLYRSVATARRTKAHADPADGSKHG